jgi:PEP-CTERM motif
MNCTQRTNRLWIVAAAGAAVAFPLAGMANANPWAGAANPVIPRVGPGIPTPSQVTGKDFSDHFDRDLLGVPDPEQNVAWDGSGGVRDSFDYSGSRPPNLAQDMQVDALGNNGDALFDSLRADRSALIFSVGDAAAGIGDANIYLEHAASYSGPKAPSIWATPLEIDAMTGIHDVDGLEVWGDDLVDDSDRYSLYGDPFFDLAPGISEKVAVWGYTAGASTPHTLTRDLAIAMDLQFVGIGLGGPLYGQLVESMDVDAMMVSGARLTFSIAPLDLSAFGLPNFDGGEIFEYDDPSMPTKFLDHGGHLWNTAFDVRGTFHVLTENVNAIEAISIPEPASLLLMLGGALGLWAMAFRRR